MLLKSALPFLAFAQAADVYFRIQVDYELLGENDNHQALHTYQKSEKFDHAYDNLGMSMEASAEGFGASGSVAFAMSQMSDDTSSSKNVESLSQNSTTTFQNGRTQVWRVVSKEMSIDGNGMTSTDRVYIYDQPADNKYDRAYWDQQAVDYLNKNLLPVGKSTTRNNFIIHENVSSKPKDDTDIHLLHTISVDFPVTGYSYTYWWQETYTYSESYVKTVRELSTSASASGSYGGVSASASFAFNTAKSRTSYTSGETKNMNANHKSYPAGQYQVWRRVKETVTINGKSSVVESIDPYDVRYTHGVNNAYNANEIQSPEYYRQKANEYLKNTLLPADVFDEKVHNQGATVYTKHSTIKGKALSEFYNTGAHIWYYEKYGRFMQCPQGYVATGLCGSGQNGDCARGKWAALRCTKLSKVSSCDYYFKGYKYGHEGNCYGDQVVTGLCGSGKNADCKINGRKYHHANKCCSADNIDIDRNDVIMFYGDHGEYKTCPDGYVLIMTCGSGRDADCSRNHTTMKCARVRPNFASLG